MLFDHTLDAFVNGFLTLNVNHTAFCIIDIYMLILYAVTSQMSYLSVGSF